MTTKIIGTGSAFPQKIISNDDLSALVETSDEWIRDRTGIRNRRVVTVESTASLAAQAAKNALQNANTLPDEIDLIIVATLSPDRLMPNTACEVQAATGCVRAVCFDLNAACSGFVFAVQTCHAYISCGLYKKAIVIGAETLSKTVDWNDRRTCVLFGDGAGAVVLSADSEGIIGVTAGADGSKGAVLTLAGQTLNSPFSQKEFGSPFIGMDGQEVFKFAVRKIPEMILELTRQANITVDQLQMILLHQANCRILQAAAKRLGIDEEKIPMNLDQYGNTSAASLPLLLDEMNQTERLIKGKPLILAGFGGGLTWGAILLNW